MEDDPGILDVLAYVFELEDYPVLRARNGQEALDILKTSEELPGLICLDLMMPVMDGQTFLRQIQTEPENMRFQKIPVLILSAARVEIVGTTVGQISKPSTVEQLLEFAKKYCGSQCAVRAGVTVNWKAQSESAPEYAATR